MSSKMMAVVVNGVAELEYDRSRELTEQQQQSLAKMDAKMKGGFSLGGEFVANPDLQQCALFVADNILQALKDDYDLLAASLTAWLANRLPDLDQVKITDKDDQVLVDLVFDDEYRNQAVVNFNLH